MSEIFRRTAYGALLQTHQAMGLQVTIPASSTLNEKLSIQPTASLGVNEVPKMRYLTIGIGGHKSVTGVDGIPLVDDEYHMATDAALYKMIPFAMRAPDQDFTALERARYCLRRIEDINGVDWITYYGLRLDMTNVVPKMVTKTVLNGTTTTVDFVPNSDNLNPVPPVINNGGSNTVEGKFVCALAELTIEFTPDMVEEILDAAVIMYGSENYSLVSELGLTSGVDRSVNTTDNNGASISYNELIAAQIFTHVNTLIPFKSQRAGFSITLDIGATEPLFKLAVTP